MRSRMRIVPTLIIFYTESIVTISQIMSIFQKCRTRFMHIISEHISRWAHLNNLLSSNGCINTAKVGKVNQNKEPNIAHNIQNLVTTRQDGHISTHQTGVSVQQRSKSKSKRGTKRIILYIEFSDHMSRQVHLNNLLSSDGCISTAKVGKVNQNKKPNITHNTVHRIQ